MNPGAIMAAQRIRKERELVAYLRDNGALSPAAATPLDPVRVLRRAALRGLVQRRAVVEAGDGQYWLDQTAYAAMRARRRRNIVWMLSLAFAAALLAIALVALKTG